VLKAFLIGGQSPGKFTVKRRDDFDVSDCAIAPSGDLLLPSSNTARLA
jgi:hypothetical protein